MINTFTCDRCKLQTPDPSQAAWYVKGTRRPICMQCYFDLFKKCVKGGSTFESAGCEGIGPPIDPNFKMKSRESKPTLTGTTR